MKLTNVKITILVENTTAIPNLIAEHGFACWVEAGEQRILFDTGQTDAVIHNAEMLGIDLRQANAIVLSHGHYDHTGGLQKVIALASRAQVFAHPAAFMPKYARDPAGNTRNIGSPYIPFRSRYVHTIHATRVAPGIQITGEIPRIEQMENGPTKFYIDQHEECPDPLADDQALVLDTEQGLVVLLGCAHAGVVNTLRCVLKRSQGNRIHAVLGGTHLRSADRGRIDWTMDALEAFGIDYIAPAHCTGEDATTAIRQRFSVKFQPCNAGTAHRF